MTEDEAKTAIARGKRWTLAKARLILAGWPIGRNDLATARDITLGLDAETVTVHRAGREVAAFAVHLMTWSDDEILHWKVTHVPPDLRDSASDD